MADKKITQLTAATTVASDNLLHIIDNPSSTPTNKKLTVKNFVGNIQHTTAGSDGDTLVKSVLTVGNGQSQTSGGLFAVRGEARNVAGTATAVSNMYGGYFEASIQNVVNTVSGKAGAIKAVVDVSDGAATLGKTNVISLTFKETGTARGAAPNSYIEIQETAVTGANPATYLFDIFPEDGRGNLTFETGGSLGFYTDDVDKTNGVKDGTLKIRVNGEVKFIQLYN